MTATDEEPTMNTETVTRYSVTVPDRAVRRAIRDYVRGMFPELSHRAYVTIEVSRGGYITATVQETVS